MGVSMRDIRQFPSISGNPPWLLLLSASAGESACYINPQSASSRIIANHVCQQDCDTTAQGNAIGFRASSGWPFPDGMEVDCGHFDRPRTAIAGRAGLSGCIGLRDLFPDDWSTPNFIVQILAVRVVCVGSANR
jgi:hypothetical protein